MPANLYPIYSVTPRIGDANANAVIGPSANTATDGTGANSFKVFTAGSNAGSFIYKVIFKPIATTAATVARLFYCSDTGTFTAGTTNTAANSQMIGEISLPAITVSQTAANPQFEIPVNFPIPISTKLFVTFGTSTGAAGNGYSPVVVAGDY